MKCPFRTRTNTKTIYGTNPFEPNYSKPIDSVVSVDFEECIENDCPYFGKEVYKITCNGTKTRTLQPICRKANE